MNNGLAIKIAIIAIIAMGLFWLSFKLPKKDPNTQSTIAIQKIDIRIDSLQNVIRLKNAVIDSITKVNSARVETLTVIDTRWQRKLEKYEESNDPHSVDTAIVCAVYGQHCNDTL